MRALLVGGFGVVGVLARYGLSLWTASLWTTAAINLAGSFALGVLWRADLGLSADVRTAIGVGLLGGFTTFSTFSVQVAAEADAGRGGRAMAYVLLSVAGGILAAFAGAAVGRSIQA